MQAIFYSIDSWHTQLLVVPPKMGAVGYEYDEGESDFIILVLPEGKNLFEIDSKEINFVDPREALPASNKI